jgi:hypothetical protein
VKQREWLVQIVIRASDAEMAHVVERVGEAICVPADHDGHCETPWTLVQTPLEDLPKPERSSWRELLDDE